SSRSPRAGSPGATPRSARRTGSSGRTRAPDGLGRFGPRRLRDHDLGRLDDRDRVVAALERQRAGGVSPDHRRDRLAADPQPHLRQETVDAYFLHDAAQLIARAETGEIRTADRRPPARLVDRRPREQTIDLALRHAMMSALRRRGADPSGVNPPLER